MEVFAFGGFPLHSNHLLDERDPTGVAMKSTCRTIPLDVWDEHWPLIFALVIGNGVGITPLREGAYDLARLYVMVRVWVNHWFEWGGRPGTGKNGRSRLVEFFVDIDVWDDLWIQLNLSVSEDEEWLPRGEDIRVC